MTTALLLPLLYLAFFAWSTALLIAALVRRNRRSAQLFAPLALLALIGLLNSAATQEAALALAGIIGR